MAEYKLTIIIPCFGRPQRTQRILDCIVRQTFYPFQCLFISDGCSSFHNNLKEGLFKRDYDSRNTIEFIELDKNYGGWGYKAREHGIKIAEGDYTIFVDNDDFILSNHFQNYYNAISDTDCDFVHLNSYLDPFDIVRYSELSFGSIGHSEIIVKTSFLKSMPPYKEFYGHDFDLIKNMINSSNKYLKINSPPTYIVKSVPHKQEIGID